MVDQILSRKEKKKREKGEGKEERTDCKRIDNKKGVNWFRRKNINLLEDNWDLSGVVLSGPIPRDERLFLWHRSVFAK